MQPVDDLLAVPHAKIAYPVVVLVFFGKLIQELCGDLVKVPFGQDALPEFGKLVGQHIVVVLVLVHIAVQAQGAQKAVARAFLHAHTLGYAGDGHMFLLDEELQQLQAFFKCLHIGNAVLSHFRPLDAAACVHVITGY